MYTSKRRNLKSSVSKNLVLLYIQHSRMNYSSEVLKRYDYLAFSGGGFYAGSFIGCKVALDHFLPQKKWLGFAGCSAGALMAFYMCLDLPANALYALFEKQSQTWTEEDLLLTGRARSERQASIFASLIEEPLYRRFKVKSMSFREFQEACGKQLCVVAHNLNEVKATYMSANTHPSHDVVCALQASMSVPFLFDPVKIDGKLMVDGGLSDNLPSGFFGAHRTLSFWIKAESSIRSTEELLGNPLAYAHQIFLSLYRSAENNLHPDGEKPMDHTVIIRLGRGATFFPSRTDAKRLKLFLFQGSSAVHQFLKGSHEDMFCIFQKIYELKDLDVATAASPLEELMDTK